MDVKVQADIGIASDGHIKVIHTHDETGIANVESPVHMDSTFGDLSEAKPSPANVSTNTAGRFR